MAKPSKYQLEVLRREVAAFDRQLAEHAERQHSDSADRQAAIRREWMARRDAAQAVIDRYVVICSKCQAPTRGLRLCRKTGLAVCRGCASPSLGKKR